MFLLRKRAKEPSQHPPETRLRVIACKASNRRLFPNDQFRFRDEIHDQLTVAAHGYLKQSTPVSQFCITLAQEPENKAAECLAQSSVWDVSLVLVEFSGCKQTACRNKRSPQFVDHRGFADA